MNSLEFKTLSPKLAEILKQKQIKDYTNEQIDYLLRHSDLNEEGQNGTLSMSIIFSSKELNLNSEQIDYLIKNSDLNKVDSNGCNVATYAFRQAQYLNSEQIDYLIKNCDLKNVDSEGFNVAMYAFTKAQYLNSEQIDYLIKNSNLDKVDSEGCSLAMFAFSKAQYLNLKLNSEQIDYLIKNSDLNKVDSKGWNGTMYAFSKAQYLNLNSEQIDYLIKNSNLSKKVKNNEELTINQYIMNLYNNKQIQLSEDSLKIILKNKEKNDSEKIGINLLSSEDEKKYKKITEYSCELLEKFAQYQSFPEKSSKFFYRLFSGKKISSISQKDIENLISQTLNIPIEIVTREIPPSSKYFELESNLKKTVIGQNKAISTVASEIISFVTSEQSKPLSFLAVGSTGVGKTKTAESIAQELNIPIIKFNMGEYKSTESVSSFVSKLQKYVINNYAGVVLFDELEKANPEVLDAILSFTDKGQIGSGNSLVTSKSQIVFMTSNMMIKQLNELSQALEEDGINEIPDRPIRQLIEHNEQLKPEFLARINSVICYNSLSKQNVKEIFIKLLSEKISAYQDNNITFNIETSDNNTLSNIFDKVYDPTGGVRIISSNLDSFFSNIMSRQDVLSFIHVKNNISDSFFCNVIDLNYVGKEIDLKINGNPISLPIDKKIEVDMDKLLNKISSLRENREKQNSNLTL